MIKKEISIVVACRNEENHIVSLLKSIEDSSFPIESVEVLVVDGMSDDNTLDRVIDFQKISDLSITTLENKFKTAPYAFNIGIRYSNANIVIIAGARFIFSSNYLKEVKEVLEDKKIGCVGGRIINICENKSSFIIAKAMASLFGIGFGNFRATLEDSYVDTVTPPAFRREIFDEIGYFDERLTRNQDDDFSFRVIKAGYKILLKANIYIEYVVRGSFSKLYKQYKQYGYWKVFVNKKHKTITTLRQLFPMLFVLSSILLFPLSFLFPVFRYLIITELFCYFVLSFVFSFKDNKFDFAKLYKQMYACLVLHISYGLGYTEGIIDFMILNKKPRTKNEELSR